MQGNAMKALAGRGGVQVGTWITFIRNPAVLALLKAAGVDFARLDMEHSAATMETVADMALLSRALDFPLIVRPPRANREWITRLLDVGVWNIHCPQVESREHAAEIVAASRYAPIGRRGNGGLSAATDFEAAGTLSERHAFANHNVFITAMLETEAAFDDLEAIAAMDGIDALTLGPADLAQDMGILGNPEQAGRLAEKQRLLLAAAKKYGKLCSMAVRNAGELQAWQKEGVTMFTHSSDAEMLASAYGQAMKAMRPR